MDLFKKFKKSKKCPIDKHSLEHIELEGVEVDRCPKCRGLWLDSGELHRLTDGEIDIWDAMFEKSSPYTCPTCKGNLTTEKLGNVKIDLCSMHGIWFKESELTTLIKKLKEINDKNKKEENEKKFVKSDEGISKF